MSQISKDEVSEGMGRRRCMMEEREEVERAEWVTGKRYGKR